MTVAGLASPIFIRPSAPPQGRQLDVPMIRQERYQCGATSLAMTMGYWNQVDPALPTRNKDEITKVINPFDAIKFDRKSLKLGPVEVGCDGTS